MKERTARNLVIAEHRKVARRRTEADPDQLERTVHPAPGQLDAVLLDEEAAIVRRLIGEMPTDRDRQILLRFYVAERGGDLRLDERDALSLSLPTTLLAPDDYTLTVEGLAPGRRPLPAGRFAFRALP